MYIIGYMVLAPHVYIDEFWLYGANPKQVYSWLYGSSPTHVYRPSVGDMVLAQHMYWLYGASPTHVYRQSISYMELAPHMYID